jgi:hypothetical protein
MKDYAGTFLLVLLTTVIGIGCYGAATHGTSQRSATDDMRRQLVAEARAIRNLEAELRTRARLPQLERWNDQVLKMSAPAASQFMASPVQLINLVTPPAPTVPAEPQLRFALAPVAPESAGKIVQARFVLDEREPNLAGATVVRAAYPAATLTRDLQETIDASVQHSLGEP